MNKKRWDIFCKIVDNFGDIGVCWRLAKQLQREHGLSVRLWVDDLNATQKIIPHLNVTSNRQIIDAICVLSWHENADFSDAADVVIEAFACELPAAYLSAMAQKKSKWINLEYLSAESWVADFHVKPSPRPDLGLTRYFYFPGFTEETGGLIQWPDLAQSNKTVSDYSAFVKQHPANLKVSLFCYPNAPIHALLDAMSESDLCTDCYVPVSSILPQIASFFNLETIAAGAHLNHKNLHVHVLPFLSQAEYDALLRDCDINFVRGEDSWVRAVWAGKPFIWQPYYQTENTHIKKLNAFLDLFYANMQQKAALYDAHQYWSTERMPQQIWQAYLDDLPAIQLHTRQQTNQIAEQTDLAAKLVLFCNKL